MSSVLPLLYKDTRSLYAYYAKIADAVSDLPILTYIFGGPIDAVALMRAGATVVALRKQIVDQLEELNWPADLNN